MDEEIETCRGRCAEEGEEGYRAGWLEYDASAAAVEELHKRNVENGVVMSVSWYGLVCGLVCVCR